MKNTAKNITKRGYPRYFSTTIISVMLLLTTQAQAALNKARLHHYSLSPQMLTFTVTSTGCTHEHDFDLLVERASSDPDAALRITVIRIKPDWCKRLPQSATFTKTLPRGHSSPFAPVTITNAVTPAPEKAPRGEAAGRLLKKSRAVKPD